ncbi:MAG TPA: DUF4922 domain-containing protein [Leptolyngbyaceae cyanobacterium]
MSESTPNNTQTLHQKPDLLWQRVIQQTEFALNCGALETIPTEYQIVEDNGINFLVRVISNLVRKDAARKEHTKDNKKPKDFNPFLPYDENLFVANISDTHVCLLNKFNVVDHHLLIVTRAFEEQETLLKFQDFEAMWLVLNEINGLAFYNSGKIAGASQPHKHLQWVPLPLSPTGEKIPIETKLATAEFEGIVGKVPSLPFLHALVKFDFPKTPSPQTAAGVTLASYRSLLKAVDLLDENSDRPKGAYNLVATPEWMLVVPRKEESFQSIPVNSLGFAGAMLVRNDEQMKMLQEFGPLNAIAKVAHSVSR